MVYGTIGWNGVYACFIHAHPTSFRFHSILTEVIASGFLVYKALFVGILKSNYQRHYPCECMQMQRLPRSRQVILTLGLIIFPTHYFYVSLSFDYFFF